MITAAPARAVCASVNVVIAGPHEFRSTNRLFYDDTEVPTNRIYSRICASDQSIASGHVALYLMQARMHPTRRGILDPRLVQQPHEKMQLGRSDARYMETHNWRQHGPYDPGFAGSIRAAGVNARQGAVDYDIITGPPPLLTHSHTYTRTHARTHARTHTQAHALSANTVPESQLVPTHARLTLGDWPSAPDSLDRSGFARRRHGARRWHGRRPACPLAGAHDPRATVIQRTACRL